MWIGCLKLSVLTREYLSSVINMLTNILKNLHITKRVLFPTQLPSQWSINMVKVVWVKFQHCLLHLTCYFPKGPRKEDFLEISLTTFFGVRNLGNTSAMRTMFFLKSSKFNLAFKNAEKNSENDFCSWNNWIWIRCLKLSLLRREYLS